MKNRIFSLILSLALLFFFAGASAFGQNKPDKITTKTEKQTEQKVAEKDAKTAINTKSTEKNIKDAKMIKEEKSTEKNVEKAEMIKESKSTENGKENTTMSKDNKDVKSKTEHHKNPITKIKDQKKEEKTSVKDETNKNLK